MQSQLSIMSEAMRLPDSLVGLIIGRGGENIMRMQRETGCRIQITQSIPGTQERPCTLTGTPEQIEVCKNMLNEIISRSQAGTLGNSFSLNSSNLITGSGSGDPMENSLEISIPADKCGLIIGKGGETIKSLQQNLGVKMLLIQDSTENLGSAKPLRISGTQMNVDNAVNAVQQLMAQRDQQIQQQKLDPSMCGDENNIPVPKAAVGVIIGKSGETISQIEKYTGTRIQFKPDQATLPNRMCSIVGSKEGVATAISRIQEIIHNVAERDGMNMGGGGAGGDRSGSMYTTGGMAFGQWESPSMNRGPGGMGGVTTEQIVVPADKTGLVIGKGGDTIKQINMQSGAHAEIQRNHVPGCDYNYKTFVIKGTPEQIKMCRELIQEKVEAHVGGGMQSGGIPSGQVPSMGNYGPPPQQGTYAGLLPAAGYGHPQQSPLQGPPGQPNPTYQQQPWANQFQQWTPPASTPHQNGIDLNKPLTDTNLASWQSYLQLYGQSQGSGAALPVPAMAANPSATPSQADYSKHWEDYLKQTGGVQTATVATLPDRSIAIAPAAANAHALHQLSAPVSGQPPTSQADYTAAWSDYYRQYYQLQGQPQYAAAAAVANGQPPAQN